MNVVSNRWLAVRLEFIGNCVIFFAALFAVLAKEFGWADNPGQIGVSISYALNVSSQDRDSDLNVSDHRGSELCCPTDFGD